MASPDQPLDIPNALVDRSAALITITEADGSSHYVPPSLFRLYAAHDVDLRSGRVDLPRPGGYDDFAARWNQDPACPYRFATRDPASGTVITVGASFPAEFLDLIDPPPVPSPPAVFQFSAAQNDIIMHMLWGTARREQYFEQKREENRDKKVVDRRSRRGEYRARDAAMGRPRTPRRKAPAVPVAPAGAVPVARGGGGARVAPTAPFIATSSDLIGGSSNSAGPSTIVNAPPQATAASGSTVVALPPPAPAPRAPSPMQEDVPDPAAAAPTASGNGLSFLDDLLDFGVDEDDGLLLGVKGKGKETA